MLYVACRDPGFINPKDYDDLKVEVYVPKGEDPNSPFATCHIY
jgi:hypothetical protein